MKALIDASRTLLATLEPVFLRPDDDEVRLVAADALIEQGHPWGEFILLQFANAGKRATPRTKTREKALLNEHVSTFCGPLFRVGGSRKIKYESATGSWSATLLRNRAFVFERGFLSSCVLGHGCPRSAWQAATSAPHWATVKTVILNPYWVPKWWVSEWVQSGWLKRLSSVLVGHHRDPHLRLDKDKHGSWVVTRSKSGAFASTLAAFAQALPPQERARLTFAPTIPERNVVSLERALKPRRK